MGSKPNITPKQVVECGLAEDASATANIPADHENDAKLEQKFEKILKGNPKCSKKRSKGKAPAVRFKLQAHATFKNGGRGSAFNEFTRTDSRYIYAKGKEFRSEDAVNVLADAEDATKCCNPRY